MHQKKKALFSESPSSLKWRMLSFQKIDVIITELLLSNVLICFMQMLSNLYANKSAQAFLETLLETPKRDRVCRENIQLLRTLLFVNGGAKRVISLHNASCSSSLLNTWEGALGFAHHNQRVSSFACACVFVICISQQGDKNIESGENKAMPDEKDFATMNVTERALSTQFPSLTCKAHVSKCIINKSLRQYCAAAAVRKFYCRLGAAAKVRDRQKKCWCAVRSRSGRKVWVCNFCRI